MDVSLTVRPGERIALIGSSGAGKSTLLRTLDGSVAPTTGTVERRGFVGLVHQDLRLVAERNALENVGNGALRELGPLRGLLGIPRILRSRAERLLAEVGLQDHAGDRVGSLSGGQRQRVAIARSLCAEPAVLLADEPLGSLDPRNAARVLTLLRNLQELHGFALLVSVHDRVADPSYFDRFVVLQDGRIACETTDAGEAWQRLEEHSSEVMGRLERNDDGAGPERSARLAVRSRRGLPVGLGLLVLTCAALLWAAHGVGLRSDSFLGAASGLSAFVGAMIPGSRAEFLALPWAQLAGSLGETIEMALLGTAVGIAASLPLSFLAARETSPRALRLPVRFLLNFVRTVPSIFWALIFVTLIGLGPVAGVFALAAYSTGYLTKLFYEALEDVDDRPALALRALGASRPQVLFRAIFPAARPLLLGACLFVFEYNVRAASVLGVVGAGGIGQDLMYYIEWRNFPAALAGLLLILAVVVLLDSLSEAWRRRLSRQRGI